jgi:glucose-1-phosphate thymidylyltransferase
LFQSLLGEGSAWSMTIDYAEQPRLDGLAQVYIIGADFVGNEPSALILGDNICHGHGLVDILSHAHRRPAAPASSPIMSTIPNLMA